MPCTEKIVGCILELLAQIRDFSLPNVPFFFFLIWNVLYIFDSINFVYLFIYVFYMSRIKRWCKVRSQGAQKIVWDVDPSFTMVGGRRERAGLLNLTPVLHLEGPLVFVVLKYLYWKQIQEYNNNSMTKVIVYKGFVSQSGGSVDLYTIHCWIELR